MILATVQTATRPAVSVRDSGRVSTRWFRALLGGYEPITAPDGTVTQEFVLDGVNVEVASGGYFGWGEQAAIEAYVAQHYADRKVVDTWPIRRPIAA